uniref:Uncharacterized protein n=1 Tax=viral metagenome TaxID=1070528 RepID=A0A6C0DHQ7_9ZZZZ
MSVDAIAIALYNKLEPLIGEPGWQSVNGQIQRKLMDLNIYKKYPDLGESITRNGLVAAINQTITDSKEKENVYTIILAILNAINIEYIVSIKIDGGRRRAKSRRRGKSRKQTKRSKRRRSV